MPRMILAFLITLVSLGAAVLMVLLVIQGLGRQAKRRQEVFLKTLESGVYDYRLLGKRKRGHAILGWGIVFTATGLGILVGLASMTDPNVLRDGGLTGSLIPMFVGIGLIVFYFLVRKLGNGSTRNGEPVMLDKEKGSTQQGLATHGRPHGSEMGEN